MSEPIKISTGKYTREGKVDVDGNVWTVKLPGAGTDLRLSQASRACKMGAARIGLLDKKIENETITEQDLEKYEEYSRDYERNERVVYEIFQSIFIDDTEDNSVVKQWINDTPTSIIMMAFNDIKSQAAGGDNGKEAGQESS